MDVVARIVEEHEGRDPERLERKWKLLAGSANAFFRGTAAVFFEDLAKERAQLPEAPMGWICGDAHVENFGVFKGANRLVYFDFNDFDEAALAPVTWELVRYATSLDLCGRDLRLPMVDRRRIVESFLATYAAALAAGKAYWIERATSEGAVRELMLGLKTRSRKKLLDKRAPMKKKGRRIDVDGEHALRLEAGERELLEGFCQEMEGPKKGFFRMIDAARRVAGNGSLGVERYVLLVEGKGGDDGNYLLDLKAERESVVGRQWREAQPKWRNEAERLLEIQHMVQAVSPAFLRAVELGGRAFLLRELMPREDRVRMGESVRDGAGLEFMARQEGRVMAWGELRSASRRGAAVADAFVEFGKDPAWRKGVAEYAVMAAERMAGYWGTWKGR